MTTKTLDPQALDKPLNTLDTPGAALAFDTPTQRFKVTRNTASFTLDTQTLDTHETLDSTILYSAKHVAAAIKASIPAGTPLSLISDPDTLDAADAESQEINTRRETRDTLDSLYEASQKHADTKHTDTDTDTKDADSKKA